MDAILTAFGIIEANYVDYSGIVLLFKTALALLIISEVFGWIKYLIRGRQ